MAQTHSFTLYDAAAGSGKTFTLVKEFLTLVLRNPDKSYYKYLLAITFTNKAVAEMKTRILDTLHDLSQWDETKTPSDMARALSNDTNLTVEELKIKAKKILKHLLHHYSYFHVETIDGFNQKLIRAFAKDLKLSSSFEVFLDTHLLITEAVDRLLEKTGEDKTITRFILDFAFEKLNQDKSWDISKDIAKASMLLFNETFSKQVSALKQKNIQEFIHFKNQLLKEQKQLAQKVVTIAQETLDLIAQSGIEEQDFSRQYFPKFLIKITLENFDVNFNLKWQDTLVAGERLYNKGFPKKNPHTAQVIDEIQPQLANRFLEIKKTLLNYQLTEALLKNLAPLSVLNLVQQEIETLKAEKNILPISDFNHIINQQIKDQPAPFIYERLGERYRHFFIDEFQDTSLLQWENLKPLIENALSQQYSDGNKGSLLLVGDVKQAIYRWRGGLPEQFLNLINLQQPFSQKQHVINLDTNYRSRKEIIAFNNHFFTFLSDYFTNTRHKKLYIEGNQQKNNRKEGGYINFTFFEPENNKEDNNLVQAEKVLSVIKNAVQNGYNHKDICVLTRKGEQAAFIGAFLTQEAIPVVSPDSLLLVSSGKVQFLINTILLSVFPEDQEAKIKWLYFLHQHKKIQTDKHSFFSQLIKASPKETTQKLNEFNIDVDLEHLQNLGLYESLEYVIRKVDLTEESDAYLFEFMDNVWQFEQNSKNGKTDFLEEWEIKQDKLSVSANEGVNGVQLMTIHKSKGLEFPVVIYPFAETDVYFQKESKVWLPLENKKYPFSEFLINYNQDLQDFGGATGKQLYDEKRQQLELDSINMLYVAFTRAIDQLYVFAEIPKDPKKDKPLSKFNQFFKAYFTSLNLWNKNQLTYELGVFTPATAQKTKKDKTVLIPKYSSTNTTLNIAIGSAVEWKEERANSIDQGNLFHTLMAKIKWVQDANEICKTLSLDNQLRLQIEGVITQPELKMYFDPAVEQIVFTEKEICTSTGVLLIPDRINIFPNNDVIIIDYKTGAQTPSHKQQIIQYENALTEMGYRVIKKQLVYLTKKQPKIIEV